MIDVLQLASLPLPETVRCIYTGLLLLLGTTLLLKLVGGEEFESPTPWMSTKYSNQLN